MKKLNIPLILGLVLIILLSLVYFFPEKWTDKNPLDITRHRTYKVVENGKEEYKVELTPLSPNKDNLFGTSRTGHDLYTRLIYGTKITINTVLLTVIMRFLLATVFGISAGMGVKVSKIIVKIFSTVFTAIPALIFSYIILSISYIQGLELEQSIIVFAVVLTIVGWGKLANQIQDKTALIMNEEFIEGEIAIGKSKYKIMMQNIIPHLMPNLAILVFLEAGMVLFLLTQLAVLNAFVGPPIIYRNLDGSVNFMVPSEAAWNNELFYGLGEIRNMQKYYYWVLLFPALAIFTGILAFNLTGEGLRIEFEKRTSKVVSILRRIALFISPRLYIEQIKRFKKYYKPVLIKTLCIFVLLLSAFTPATKSIYEFNTEESLKHVNELTKEKYEGRMTGYEGGYKAGEYIIDTLKDYGIEPYDGENFSQDFLLTERGIVRRNGINALIREAEILLKNENGLIERYELGKDFSFIAIKGEYVSDDFKEEFIEIDGKTILHDNLDSTESNNEDEFIIVEKIDSNREMLKKLYTYTKPSQSFVKKDICFLVHNDPYLNRSSSMFNQYTTYIIPFGNLKDKIISGSYEINIKIKKPDIPKYPSRNIFGVLPGKDWGKPIQKGEKKKIIMIGATYDSLGFNSVKGKQSAFDASGTAVNLELARVLSQLKGELDETILFAFWDGGYTRYSGSYYYSINVRPFSPNLYDIIYFDIGDIADDSYEKIEVVIDQHQSMNLNNSHEVIRNIKESLKKQNISHAVLPVERGDSPFHLLFNSANLRVRLAAPRDEYLFTPNDSTENIDKGKMKDIGQFILDMTTIEGVFK